MTVLSRRSEPTFDHDDSRSGHVDDIGSADDGSGSRHPSREPASERSLRTPGSLALPWIGLAAAALALALPVLGRAGSGAPALEPAPPVAMPRLADEDEIVTGRFTLRLAGASSADELWRRWSEMKQRRLGLLDDVSASVRPVLGHGTGYLLLVGDFRNAATAAEACGTLRARFVTCDVVHRNGSTLQPQA